MNAIITNYYFLKECLEKISSSVTNELPKDNSIYFNLANFSNVSSYAFIYNPFLKDKYEIDKKIKENYQSFLIECAIEFKFNMEESDSYFQECLIFLYGLITTNTLRSYLDPYIKGIKKDSCNFDLAYNIIDTYIAAKITKGKDKINLTKESILSIFKDSYTYYDSIEVLIRNPMVKCFKFMGTNSYFKKSYSRFYKAAKYSNKMNKIGPYKLYDKLFARNKRKKEYLIYTNKEDAELLNLKKDKYIINGIEHNHTLYEVMDLAKEDAIKKINALNEYLFMPKSDQDFRNEFHIDKEKKL